METVKKQNNPHQFNSGSTRVNTLNIAINVLAQKGNISTDTVSNDYIGAGCAESISNPTSGTPYSLQYYNSTYNMDYTTVFYKNPILGNITAMVGINGDSSNAVRIYA